MTIIDDGFGNSIHDYDVAGCMQLEVPVLAAALWLEVNGRICRGCPLNNKCDAQKTLKNRRDKPLTSRSVGSAPDVRVGPTSVVYEETVREEAERRNIGIKEVRRQRKVASLNTTP